MCVYVCVCGLSVKVCKDVKHLVRGGGINLLQRSLVHNMSDNCRGIETLPFLHLF